MNHLSSAVALSLALTATMTVGCKLGSNAVGGPSPVDLRAQIPGGTFTGVANPFNFTPKIDRSGPKVPDDGMSHVQVKLTIVEDGIQAGPRFRIQALPASWGTAVVTLFSATANTTYDDARHRVDIADTAFGGAPLTATTTFPPLRPAEDYTARVFLTNDNGGALAFPRVGGSAEILSQDLAAGANLLDFTITVNTAEATYAVATGAGSSLYNNQTSGNHITEGDTVRLVTGLLANQPGVGRVEVRLTGPVYPAGTLLARIDNAANFNQYDWDTSATGVAPSDYLPGSLVAPNAGTGVATGLIEIEAFHPFDFTNEIGKATFQVNVFGRPTVSVRLQP